MLASPIMVSLILSEVGTIVYFLDRPFVVCCTFRSLLSSECYIMYLKNFLIWQSWKCFFDLEDAGHGVGGLGIGHGGRQQAFTLSQACFLALLQILYLFLRVHP